MLSSSQKIAMHGMQLANSLEDSALVAIATKRTKNYSVLGNCVALSFLPFFLKNKQQLVYIRYHIQT